MSLEVTRRCVARCVMCNLWRSPRDAPELAAAEWLDLLCAPELRRLKELDVTGGEPFLRSDLAELLEGVCTLKRTHLRRLHSVAVTTNGFLTRAVLDGVGRLVGPFERAGVELVLVLGMDAVGELHDRIRNYRNGWARLHETVEGLSELRARHAPLVLGIKTTVTRYNVGELDRVAAYAREHGLFAIISPFLLTPARYDNLDRAEALELSPRDRAALERFYDTTPLQWVSYRDELRRFLETGRMEKPCSAGLNYYFVRSSGDVLPCPLIPVCLGNVRRTAFGALVRSGPARAFRKRVGRFPACSTCTEPGLERYALPFEGWHYLRLYRSLGREAFFELHRHLGLDKYL
ncbi:MAG: radical SAM protein [Deferrisomatales bacterium]